MYSECLVYTILHQSIVIQGNLICVLFSDLVAELPTVVFSVYDVIYRNLENIRR